MDIDTALDIDIALLSWIPREVEASTMHLMETLCGIAMETPLGKPAARNTKAIQPAQGSGLFSLSPELRNNIYEEVLVDAENIEIPKDGKLIRPPLLKICRQIAEEASTIFYGLNTFKSTHYRLEGLPLWFARLPMKLRRSINVIDLWYETEAEMNNLAHEHHTETALGDGPPEQIFSAEERIMSANKKFLTAALQMALLGLDLNIFRLPPQPLVSDSARDPSQTDLAVLIRKAQEELVSLRGLSWTGGANLNILRYSGVSDSRRFQQHREDEEWLRKMAADTNMENVMARMPAIISIIQG
ncbi:hypothetical protein KC340_g12937 [Hortaea werneckii]|nr:hypothetical protein KC342_g6330 [Hortaea werneckii]KAI7098475.1 hypothetical protein KC339_g8913 [Hortaea werneckii]KAI7214072.1 hypothetical protein KC365_g14059 [Hortaea werneckii]KAI7301821.1 hypothetical protein KC340_g12937 [Hortaea werneckii]KAI7377880.1 hypothetical protein KC328_g14189 [Hortaea werneckii]